jgi:DNA-binding HxlR family transcriptional regulator/catechol 2,3-dioxygenase-like lactoylglutathione lyase family enzyme
MADSATHGKLARKALRRLNEKWTPELLKLLSNGPSHYNELCRKLGITAKVLAARLRALEHDGFVARAEWPGPHFMVTYELTPLGTSLIDLLKMVDEWSDQTERNDRCRAAEVSGDGPTPALRRGFEHAGLEASVLTHVCAAVEDINRADAAFSALFGRPTRAGGDDMFACRAFRVSNFCFEMIQSLRESTPLSEFLRRSGPGVHHLGFRIRDEFETCVTALTEHGARHTLGSVNEGYAHFDFTEELGSTVEIIRPYTDPATFGDRPGPGAATAFARSHVSHIGVMVHDVVRARSSYVDILGVGASPVRTISPAFSQDVIRSGSPSARVVTIRRSGIVLLLIEPVGPSPWRDFLDCRGNAVHHVGLSVGDQLEDAIAALRQSGARQILGRDGTGFAQFDCTDAFGFTIEVVGRRSRTGYAPRVTSPDAQRVSGRRA